MKREHLQITFRSKILTLLLFFSLITGVSWSQVILSEDFSSASGSTPPTDWSNTALDGTSNLWMFNNPGDRDLDGAGFSGQFAIFDSDELGTGVESHSVLETPEFDASGDGFIVLGFDNQMRYLSGQTTEVDVWNGTTWVNIYSPSSSDGYPTPNYKTFDITDAADGYTAAKVRFRFEGEWTWWWAVDNVLIERVPCLAPNELSADDITSEGATITWSGSGAYILEYGLAGFTPGTGSSAGTGGTIVDPAASPYTITGLLTSTDYDIYVRAECDDAYSENVLVSLTTAAAPPANDDCENAIEALVNTDLTCSIVTSGTTESATLTDGETDPGCGSATGLDDDVWFYFEATSTAHSISVMNITAVVGSSTDMVSAVYSGTCGDLVVEACSDPNSYTVDGLTIGETYYVRVWTYGTSSQTEFNLCIAPLATEAPENDDCDGAIAFPEIIPDGTCSSVIASTSSATSSGLSACAGSGADDDVWYSFVCPTGHTELLYSISSILGNTDRVIQFFEGDGCGSLTSIECFDPESGYISDLTPGETYYLRVHTYGTGSWTSVEICLKTRPAGSSCEDPIEVTTLPYTHTSNTSEYGDNPDIEGSAGSFCGSTSSYLNGDDVVYEFTSSVTGTVDIELTDITNTYAGIFVYSSCDDIGVSCMDGGVNGSSTADIILEDFAVETGSTYYIVISTWASPQNTGYTLNIVPPPACDDPEVIFPESVSATTTSAEVCASGIVNLGLDEEMPDALGITYVWEKSASSDGSYTAVSSELSVPGFSYEPGEGDDGGYFRCKIYCNDEEIMTSNTVAVSVSIPVAPELTNGERCGPGSVTLTGSIEDGTIYWYEEEVGGIPFATGEEISTPSISETTTFYATGGASPSYYAQIGTSTTSTSIEDPGPFSNYYRKYTMQLLYKSEQIIAAGGTPGGDIRELQFNLTGLPAYELPGYTISIKSVPSTMSTLTWQSTGFTEIFGGSDFDYLPTSTGWQSFPFESPFTWDDSSHIVIQVCWSQISPDWDESGTHQYTSTSGQMLYYRADSEGNACGTTGSSTSSYLPNAKFLFDGCETSREPVLALIHQVPEITFEEDEPSVCENQNTNLVASSTESTDTIKWYASESAATPLHTGSTYTTPDLTETTTYYVSTNNDNCSSERIAITVTVNPYPDVMADEEEICAGNAVTLNATSSNEEATFAWYSTATSTEVLSSSASFTTPSLTASTSYFVAADFNGCSSDRIEVEVTVNPSPEVTVTPEDEELCLFGSTTINATSSLSGTTFEWFADATATEPLETGSAFETPVIFATTSYFVEGTSGDGCVSGREEVTITVNNPEITAENSYYICDPHSVTLTAEAAEGATIGWYESSGDEEPIATGSSFTTPVISETTTYYVAATENGCRSYMDAVTVYREAYEFEIEEFAFCPNEEYLAIPLSVATTPETTIYWYSDEELYDLIYTGESYIAPTPESTTTYYVTAEGENCTTDPRAVTITVYPLPSVSIEPESELVCSGEFVTFVATPLDEQTYEYIWTPTGTEGATLTTDEAGTHTVLITSVDYGCSITQTVVLDTVPAPYVAGFDYYPEIFTNPLLYVFTPTDTAHLTGYSWDFGDGHTSEEFEVHHEYAEFGTYTVTFHFYNECDTNSISLEIYVHPSTSIDHSELNHHVDVYPNPANQDLNISITNGNQITKVSVYNHLGQLMLHETVNNETKYSFSVAPLAQGTYYMLIDTKTGQQAIKKFVIQH